MPNMSSVPPVCAAPDEAVVAPPVLPPTVPAPELLPEQALITIVSTASPEIEAIRRNVTVPPGKELPATRAHVRYPCKVGSANPQCQARHARSRPNREQGPAPATRPDKSTDREQVWFGRSPPLRSTSCLRSGLCLALECIRPRLAEAAPLSTRNADTFTAYRSARECAPSIPCRSRTAPTSARSPSDSRWIRNSRCSTGHGGQASKSRGGTPPRIPAPGTPAPSSPGSPHERPGRVSAGRMSVEAPQERFASGIGRQHHSEAAERQSQQDEPRPHQIATRFSHKDSSAESVAV